MKTAGISQLLELIVFDLDGTLIDSKWDIADSVNYTLETMGLKPLPVETVASFIGKGVKNLLMQSLGAKAHAKFDSALKVFRRHYGEHCLDRTRLYPGAEEMLESLDGLKKAIVTNKPGVFTETILKGLGISGYFDMVLGGDEVPRKKPSPEPIYILLKKFRAVPTKLLITGDSPMDIQMGKAAGIRTCAVGYGYGAKEDLEAEKPDFFISHLKELTGLLAAIR
ncbi:MAG: HAD-IA family hydrolase [Candidatus Omnitrophica bacterium]|nr:HAD-IA family hydrolase [Candidatus Omnitrophota bacterium]